MAEKAAEKKLNFEQALARLEVIVAEMESGALSLDKLVSHFEEGSALVKYCGQKLDEVEKKVEILLQKGGTTVAQPFDPQATTPTGGDESAAGAPF